MLLLICCRSSTVYRVGSVAGARAIQRALRVAMESTAGVAAATWASMLADLMLEPDDVAGGREEEEEIDRLPASASQSRSFALPGLPCASPGSSRRGRD